MKFLTVSLYHPRVMRGGAQYVAKDLHDAASADGDIDAVMLAAIDGQMFSQYAKVGASITGLPDGNNEYLLPGQRFNDFYHIIYDARRNKAVARFLLDHRPDVIHIHHSIWVGLEFLHLARKVLPDVKIIYTLHEYAAICNERGQLFRYHERSICTDASPDQCNKCFPSITADEFILRRDNFKRAFALVDHFISPSQYLADRFIEWGLPADKISVVPNGHERRRPDNWAAKHSSDVNVFGFFGQYVDAKGIDVLLEAAVQVADEHSIEIKIFGGNKQYASEKYVARIESILGEESEDLKVTESGAYSRDNVFALMTMVDWVVVPSVWPETFGLVVSEAWDARRPVIASAAGGLGERIVDGQNGFSFLPGSSAQLAEIMRSCVGNAELWRKLVSTMSDEISMQEAWQVHKKIAHDLLAG